MTPGMTRARRMRAHLWDAAPLFVEPMNVMALTFRPASFSPDFCARRTQRITQWHLLAADALQ